MYNSNFQQPSYFQGYGYNYQPQPVKPPTQPITPEMMKQLNAKSEINQIALTQDDMIRSSCTHKHPVTGAIALEPLTNGRHRCLICGDEFDVNQYDDNEVKQAVDIVKNILQQTKMYWYDINPEICKDYMPMIKLLDNVSRLYNIALDHFDRINGSASMIPTNNSYGGFAAVDSVIAQGVVPNYYGMPVAPGYGGYPQPNYGAPAYLQQPQAYPQAAPNVAPNPQQSVYGMNYGPIGTGNAFGYEASPQVPVAQTPMYSQQQNVMPNFGAFQPQVQNTVVQQNPQAPVAPMPQAQSAMPTQQAPQVPVPSQPVAPPTEPATVEKKFSL